MFYLEIFLGISLFICLSFLLHSLIILNKFSSNYIPTIPVPSGYDVYSTNKKNITISNLVERNIFLLLNKGINIDKIRFTFQPSVSYDFIKDIINPNTSLMLPMMDNGLFDKNRAPVIIGTDERNNRTIINVKSYCNPTDWTELINQINNSDKGFLFMLQDENNQHTETDTPMIRYANIDEEIAFINNIN